MLKLPCRSCGEFPLDSSALHAGTSHEPRPNTRPHHHTCSSSHSLLDFSSLYISTSVSIQTVGTHDLAKSCFSSLYCLQGAGTVPSKTISRVYRDMHDLYIKICRIEKNVIYICSNTIYIFFKRWRTICIASAQSCSVSPSWPRMSS